MKARGSSSRRDVAFALVEHLDVAAERDRGDHPLGAVGAERAGSTERAAEADREAQDLHAAQARDEVVAELVDDDQEAERDDEGERW